MEVRAAAAADAPELAQLWREFGSYYAEVDPERFQVPAARPELPDARWLVAEEGGEVVGFAAGRILPPHPDADAQLLTDASATRLGVDAVFVRSDHRRHGIAAALIAALEQWALAQGAEIVLAETAVDSPDAVPFWERSAGYDRTSVRYRKRLK